MSIAYDGTARQLAARIPQALYRAVKLAAVAEQVTMQEWVSDALETHLRRVTGPTAPDAPRRPRKPTPLASA